MANIDYSKPHPDAILCRISTGEVMEYPSDPRARNVLEDLADAQSLGYVIAVPVVRTSDGLPRYHSIEAQVGGRETIDRMLRQHRKHHGRDVPERMLASEWDRLSPEDRAGYLDNVPAVDPRDALIAALEKQLAAQAAQADDAKADKKGGK